MTRGLTLAWVGAAVAALVSVSAAGARYWSARGRATTELARVRLVTSDARELARLRAGAPSWTAQERPGAGLAARVSAALAGCGLPASALSTLSPEAESGVGETDLRARRTRAVVTLAPVTLPQLGGFLAAWRSGNPEWTVGSIDIAPQSAAGAASGSGGDLPLRALVTLETLFVDREGGAR
jgi:hypothetical protein